VTGSAKSIGRAFADALAGAGANVVIADIDDGAPAAAEIARAHGVETLAVTTDVSDEAAVKKLVAAAVERFGAIDILVNNAAYFATMPMMPYHEISAEMWDKVMAVNTRGPFLMAKHVAPLMVERRSGKIINIGSGSAYKGIPGMLAYVASKAAILGFTRTLSRELGASNVQVNTLSPGLTESESVLANPHHLAPTEKILASRAIPRAQMPEDLIGALLFLASALSDFVTGQTIAVDGGSINT
jgi:NAD(P)-dependent dehydrogenase (short-subunit alcohol dehydrogenase family)